MPSSFSAWGCCARRVLAFVAVSLLVLVAGGCATGASRPDAAPTTRSESDAAGIARVGTLLMFEGRGEEAMTFYTSLLEDARVLDVERFGPGESGVEGSIKFGCFELAGTPFFVFDSFVPHAFTFTPAMSIFLTCRDRAEFERLFERLSADGEVFMPPADYGFSARFAWTADRFGVSWQLNLPHE